MQKIRDLELELEPKIRRTDPTVVPRDSCHSKYILTGSGYLAE